MKKILGLLVIALLGLIEPAWGATDKASPVKVVATFSILGDMIRQIGGDAVQLTVLAGPDADLHTFQPSPKDVKAIAEADIIAINGLGLDRWMEPLIRSSRTHAKLLVASAGVKARIFGEGKSAVADPHAWQDLRNGRLYARNITGALMNAAPAYAEDILERGKKYNNKLKETDEWVRRQFDDIPPEKRKIITTHDAFGYFGNAYDIQFIAPLGLSTESEASALDVAQLIEQIKKEKVKEVFIENMADPRLMEQIAHDSGARLGGTLYSDSLSPPDGPTPTYLDMFRNNVPKMREAMGR